MTLEEKAKEFDASLERAKELRETCDSTAVIGWCEYIFPMLKEPKTEDEKIRKEIIDFLWKEKIFLQEIHLSVENSPKYRFVMDAIAWLEKQGQSKKTSIWKHWKDGIAGNGDGIPVFLIKNGSTYSLSSCLGFECDYIELSELDNLMLEKQGEQNHTDKVKPKFKVKYANCEYNVLEIKEIAGITYFGIEDEPNHIDYVLPDNCEIVSGYGYGVKEKSSPYPTKSAIFSEQNLAWSEEDEVMCQETIDWFEQKCFPYASEEENPARKSIQWLKSLKERLQ